jgi:hypothetical protein
MLSHSPVKTIATIFKELILINYTQLRVTVPNSAADRQKNIAITLNAKYL